MQNNDMRDWFTSFGFWAACVVLGALFVASCADDTGCDDDAAECEQESRIPRDAKLLPYKPPPALIEQRVVSATPDFMWTSGIISPVNDPAWNIATGGLNKWNSLAQGAWVEYRTTVNAILGQSTTAPTCTQDVFAPYWQPTMLCAGKAYRCPMAQVKAPIAHSNGGGMPNYDMSPYVVISRGSLWASSVYLRSAASGRYVECLYQTTSASLVMAKTGWRRAL